MIKVDPDVVGLLIAAGVGLFTWLAVAASNASYRLGVNDGYGFAKEPTNPGYDKALDILLTYGWDHRPDWPRPGATSKRWLRGRK